MMPEITRLLDAVEGGDLQAANELLPLVYHELRRLAEQKLAAERPGQTLQATALVHEAFIRLCGPGATTRLWEGRRHFFGAAAEAMRRILVDNARRKQTHKHGGAAAREEFDASQIAAPQRSEDLLALDDALKKLAEADASACELVKLRYFAGLTLPEAAEMLQMSPRSADRLWAYARAWLHRQINGQER